MKHVNLTNMHSGQLDATLELNPTDIVFKSILIQIKTLPVMHDSIKSLLFNYLWLTFRIQFAISATFCKSFRANADWQYYAAYLAWIAFWALYFARSIFINKISIPSAFMMQAELFLKIDRVICMNDDATSFIAQWHRSSPFSHDRNRYRNYWWWRATVICISHSECSPIYFYHLTLRCNTQRNMCHCSNLNMKPKSL